MTDATTRNRYVAAAPRVPAADIPAVARRAQLDAVELASDLRDFNPVEIWGRLAEWGRVDPIRLYAAVTALAAMVPMVPIDEPVSRLLAWTEHLAVAA